MIHYTGTNSAEEAISWLINSRGKEAVSAHLHVAKDGHVVQLVPFNLKAWHAGPSEYEGECGCNLFSIGIENQGIGDSWPDAQVEANRAIIEALCNAYPIEDVVGHEDICVPVGRKVDPGPKYPWHKVVEYEAPEGTPEEPKE